MAMTLKFDSDERIILKEERVLAEGMRGTYADELVLTNKNLIHVRKGMISNIKEIVKYPLSTITQAIIVKGPNLYKRIEINCGGHMIWFEFSNNRDRNCKIWQMAIEDLLAGNNEQHDYNYYQNFTADNLNLDEYASSSNTSNNSFLVDVADKIVKSKDYSIKGVVNGVKKASKKQIAKGIFSQMTDEFKEELGVYQIQEEFENVGNDLREALGLKRKVTTQELREQQLNDAFKKRADEIKKESQREQSESVESVDDIPLEKKLEMLKKLKELYDAGVLTNEEFETKKREIMNSI